MRFGGPMAAVRSRQATKRTASTLLGRSAASLVDHIGARSNALVDFFILLESVDCVSEKACRLARIRALCLVLAATTH
jgi:hypothetical protein